MKKASTISTGKSGTSGHGGKSGLKVNSTLTSGPKLPSVAPAAGKSYASSGSYITPRSNKSSSSFSIIWLPGRKKNKHKETVYNSHRNEHPKERAPSMYNIMSGDSSNQQTLLKKKEEEPDLSVSDQSGNTSGVMAGAGVLASSELSPDIVSANPEDKSENQGLFKHDKEDSKEAAGDTKDIGNVDKSNLEHKKEEGSPETKTEKGALEDNVDSVFLRSPPPHKTRSQTSTVEEEDCGIKCLYYTLQCCDCVLM